MTRQGKTTVRTRIATAVLASFVVSGVFGTAILFAPLPALAVGGVVTDPGATAAQVPGTAAAVAQTPIAANNTGQNTANNVTGQKQTVLQQVKQALATVASLAILNAADFFLKKLAYDAANALASAGNGQQPLFVTEGFGNYLKNTALDAAGEAIGTISQAGGFDKLGIDLCAPKLPKVSLNIQLGFINDLKKSTGPVSPNGDRKSVV